MPVYEKNDIIEVWGSIDISKDDSIEIGGKRYSTSFISCTRCRRQITTCIYINSELNIYCATCVDKNTC